MSRRPPPVDPASLVSDHAVLRWLERITGVDVRGPVVEAMLGDGRAELVRVVHNGQIRIAGTDAILKIADGKVVTVLSNSVIKQPSKPRRRK
ncbi:hypothetical protein [Microcystis phage vB_MaeS-yong1]|nr:hypothetical protein [Microcystis phage vB_MaeS-yong1]